MSRCQQCTYAIGTRYRCQNQASCRLGCILFCWVHAAVHGIHTVCHDKVEQGEESTKEEDEIMAQLQAHSDQLIALREKMKGLQIPSDRMRELETQLNQVYELLYVDEV